MCRLGYARISHGGLTDTELQVGKFRLPEYKGEQDNERLLITPRMYPSGHTSLLRKYNDSLLSVASNPCIPAGLESACATSITMLIKADITITWILQNISLVQHVNSVRMRIRIQS